MTRHVLRQGRLDAGWTQEQLAARLGVTQEYVSLMERGRRPVPARVARAATRLLGLAPTSLPMPTTATSGAASEACVARALARLGYPGLAYLRASGAKQNPAEVLLRALARDRLDPRLLEALPWLLLHFEGFDRDALVNSAKLGNLQNRLGFVVATARELAETRARWLPRLRDLRALEEDLEPARLAREEPLGAAVRSDRMREWLRRNRPAAAAHWNLLTDLRPEHLSYADDDRGTLA